MSSHINSQAAACPSQKFALGGHSQGAVVTHDALPRINRAYLNRIVAITTFGDPRQASGEQNIPAQLADRVKYNCLPGDLVSNHRISTRTKLANVDFNRFVVPPVQIHKHI